MQINTISAETLSRILGDLPPDMPVAVALGNELFAIWNENVGHRIPITFYDDHDNSMMVTVAVIDLPGLKLGLAR